MLYRKTGMIIAVIGLLAACTPTPPMLEAPDMTEQPISGVVSEPTSDLSAYYGNIPPAATLIVNGQEQTGQIGTYTWIAEKSGDETRTIHADAFALVTPAEPLVVTAPLTATLILPIPAAPSHLGYTITPVVAELRRHPGDQERISWEVAIEQPGTSLVLEREQEIPLSLEPGQYLLEVFAGWADLGSASYGFYLEVQRAHDALLPTPASTSTDTPDPPPAPTIVETPSRVTDTDQAVDCSAVERLATDSPAAQQILDEFVAYYKEQYPTEYMGMAILHRVDRLGEWAIVQGSVSGEAKDVLAVRQTSQGYQLTERYIITAPLASFDEPEKLVPEYFLERLPEAPPALFTCLDQSWLLAGGYSGASSDVYQLAYIGTSDSTTEGVTEIITLHSDGSNRATILSEPMLILGLVPSPDGERIAFWGCPGSLANDCSAGEDLDVWVVNWDGSNLRNLTEDSAADDSQPDWSPDGEQIVFDSDRSGDPHLYVMNADGSNPRALTDGPGQNTEPKWSPDGKFIAYHCSQEGETRICVLSPDGRPAGDPIAGAMPVWSPGSSEGGGKLAFLCFQDGHSDICTARVDGLEVVNLTDSPADEHSLAWSPDGNWLAFVSNRGDDVDVYKVCATCPEEPAVVRLTDQPRSTGWPAWSPDGGQVAYVDMGGQDLLLVNADRSDATYLASGVFGPPIWQPER